MFKVAILQKRALNAQIEKNMESIIMAMRKALQMMIKALQKYARKRKNIK